MSIATYRGCKYNTNTPKQEYQHWYSETHAHPIHRMYIVVMHIVHATTGIGRKVNELVKYYP